MAGDPQEDQRGRRAYRSTLGSGLLPVAHHPETPQQASDANISIHIWVHACALGRLWRLVKCLGRRAAESQQRTGMRLRLEPSHARLATRAQREESRESVILTAACSELPWCERKRAELFGKWETEARRANQNMTQGPDGAGSGCAGWQRDGACNIDCVRCKQEEEETIVCAEIGECRISLLLLVVAERAKRCGRSCVPAPAQLQPSEKHQPPHPSSLPMSLQYCRSGLVARVAGEPG
jgi:hypothetical protein